MPEAPPPLAWLDGFVRSIEGATGSRIVWSLTPTINPLVHKVRFFFPEPISGKSLMLVWNLFQMYAAKNDCVPQGKRSEEKALFAEIVTKRRLGPPRNEHPLE